MSPISVLLFLLAGFTSILLLLLMRGYQQNQKKTESERSKKRAEQLAVAVKPKIYHESAFMLQKIDQRRRIMDEFHHTKITDESFELVFQLQNGELARVSCTKTTYNEMPFRKTGILTYSNGRLLRFKTAEQDFLDDTSQR